MSNFLSQLPKIVGRRKKRLGRGLGSGKGAKSGRGTTRHQKARESIPLHFEGAQGRMVKKFPLLRGKGRNKSLKPKPLIVSLEKLNRFQDGETINLTKLIEAKVVSKEASETGVKILAKGEVTKKLTVELPVSRTVKTKIEKAGGKVKSV